MQRTKGNVCRNRMCFKMFVGLLREVTNKLYFRQAVEDSYIQELT